VANLQDLKKYENKINYDRKIQMGLVFVGDYGGGLRLKI
jgi:hypothetical protein